MSRRLPDDRDIYRTAMALIEGIGAVSAELQAAYWADQLLALGDRDRRWTWLRIVEAVRALTATAPPAPGTAVH